MYQILNLPIVKKRPQSLQKPRKRKVSSSKIPRLNARIKLKLKNSRYRIKGGRKVRNFSRNSYFAKFILRKSLAYKRTHLLPGGRNLNYKRFTFGYERRRKEYKDYLLKKYEFDRMRALARKHEQRKKNLHKKGLHPEVYDMKDAVIRYMEPGIKLEFPQIYKTNRNPMAETDRMLRDILQRKGKMKPILPYRLGLITVRRKRRNFFATIHKYLHPNMKVDLFEVVQAQMRKIKKFRPRSLRKLERPRQEVVFKSSVGQTGYIGPKRNSILGTKRVGKACSHFLRRNKFTGYDLLFTRDFSRRYNFFIRGLLHARFWVRRIVISRHRSHGFTRRKKPRR